MDVLAETSPFSLADELTAHALASIEAADHFSSPFPHIVFRDFFPPDFYQHLTQSIPAEGYDPITGSGTRVALRLYGDNIDKIDPALRPIWTAVSSVLSSKSIEQAIRRKLHRALSARGQR